MSDRSQAMYVGTFDPLTNGHFDIITRASKLFDSLVIGIGHNHDKQMLFTPEQREEMIVETCTHLPNVRTTKFSGLAVEHALAEGITIMIRGLRTEADYTYEMQMAMMNRTLCKDMEILFIPTRQSLSHISSSLVKQVASLGGDISGFVPTPVFKELSNQFSK